MEVSLERHASDSIQLVAKINTFLIYKQKKQANKQKLAYFFRLDSWRVRKQLAIKVFVLYYVDPQTDCCPPEFQPKCVGNDPDERNTKIE